MTAALPETGVVRDASEIIQIALAGDMTTAAALAQTHLTNNPADARLLRTLGVIAAGDETAAIALRKILSELLHWAVAAETGREQDA